MTPDVLKFLVGTFLAIAGALCSGVILLLRTAQAAGRREGKLDQALDKLNKIDGHLEKIPIHETRIGQLEEMFKGLRSDIKSLLRGSSRWEDRGE